MGQASMTKTVNAPAEKVWGVISDYGNIHRYHPEVAASPLLTAQAEGLGAIRRCEFYDGTNLVEEIIDWREGESLQVVLSEMDMPLKRAEATVAVAELTKNTSEVTIRMDYEVKFGLMGRLMDAVMMRRMMRRMFGGVIDGLAHHVITGEVIGKGGTPRPASQGTPH